MMEDIKQILDFIRRTNPEMTLEHLRKELQNDKLTACVLGIMIENKK
jgi:hypothetical protein